MRKFEIHYSGIVTVEADTVEEILASTTYGSDVDKVYELPRKPCSICNGSGSCRGYNCGDCYGSGYAEKDRIY